MDFSLAQEKRLTTETISIIELLFERTKYRKYTMWHLDSLRDCETQDNDSD